MKFFKTISAYWAFGMILNDCRDGDLASVRRRLDCFLDQHADDYPFMLVFDAALMFGEERNDEARERISDCLEALPDDDTPDTKYVTLYCRFIQNLHVDHEWRAALKEAKQLEVSPLIKAFLKFPSEERVSEIVREERRARKSVPVIFDF